jgi:sugar/nucleoside kinase (ribokinase family)
VTVDYLVIGHVSRDLTDSGPMLGGTVSYSALTARALGRRAAILTSAPDDMLPLLKPLEAVPCVRVPSANPTSFELAYTPEGRVLRLVHRAAPLDFEHLPPGWRSPAVVQLSPIADEVAPSLANRFPGALVTVTPQGWMRRWDDAGRVSRMPWANASEVLPYVRAVVLSVDDIGGDEALARRYATQVAVLALTRGPDDITLYVDSRPHPIPVPAVEVRDETGAGDIFAAAFSIHLEATGDPFTAARFAVAIASASVTQVGVDSIPDAATIEKALASL